MFTKQQYPLKMNASANEIETRETLLFPSIQPSSRSKPATWHRQPTEESASEMAPAASLLHYETDTNKRVPNLATYIWIALEQL